MMRQCFSRRNCSALFYLYQLNLEIQLLTRHLMVGVEGDGLLVFGGYLHRERLAKLVGQVYALAHLQFLRARCV